MKTNRFREVIASGRMPVGHMVLEFATRGIARILESVDLDFVVFDMEHSGFDVDRIYDLVAWAKATPLTPFVRVPQNEYHFLARVMDSGAMGVMVPNVETAEAAQAIVNAVKYPQDGKRGVALGTTHTDFLTPPDPAEYYREINASSVVICQIESSIGVANAESIAAVPGVDCLWIGHMDLSTSLGIPGRFDDGLFTQAMATVVSAARKHGKLLGIQPGTAHQADAWIGAGFNVISWGSDVGVYRSALASGVAALRSR